MAKLDKLCSAINKLTMKYYQLVVLSLLLVIGCTTTKVTNKQPDYKQTIENYRVSYKAKFLKAERSPLSKDDLEHLHFYPADENFKVVAKFQKTANGKPFEVSTSSGSKKSYIEYGKATFTIYDTICTLSIYTSPQLQRMPQYRDYLFLPFKDFTNGETTYGGGRYLDLKTGDIQGETENQTIIIDFNKCYNPYCAYQSEGWNCPIPPDENHLEIYIKAGEMDFEK